MNVHFDTQARQKAVNLTKREKARIKTVHLICAELVHHADTPSLRGACLEARDGLDRIVSAFCTDPTPATPATNGKPAADAANTELQLEANHEQEALAS